MQFYRHWRSGWGGGWVVIWFVSHLGALGELRAQVRSGTRSWKCAVPGLSGSRSQECFLGHALLRSLSWDARVGILSVVAPWIAVFGLLAWECLPRIASIDSLIVAHRPKDPANQKTPPNKK